MKHTEIASELFSKRYYCSQAVLAAFAEELGMTKERALRVGAYYVQRFDAAEHLSSTQAVARAADYMEAHYAEQITLSDPAHVAELSEGYLCRLFTQYFHARPIAYLNRLRIQKANAMLNRSYLSAESVAEACGVENPSNFTNLFRQTEGITPSAYRNMVNI